MAQEMIEGRVPIPDPTKLTTDAVHAAEVRIERLFHTKLDDLEKLVNEKFIGRDKALEAALAAAERLVKQHNDASTIAIDKAAVSTEKQIDALRLRIDDLKEMISEMRSRNWAAVGGYIVGAIGVVVAVVSAASVLLK